MTAKVLFVCVGNSCRSQMAEAFANAAGLHAESAGTEPAPGVSSRAIQVMQEVGIDMSHHTPKVLDWDRLKEFDRTITMGCGVEESCPALRTDADWGLDDPADRDLEFFRVVRDDIKARVDALAAELSAPGAASTA